MNVFVVVTPHLNYSLLAFNLVGAKVLFCICFISYVDERILIKRKKIRLLISQ